MSKMTQSLNEENGTSLNGGNDPSFDKEMAQV